MRTIWAPQILVAVQLPGRNYTTIKILMGLARGDHWHSDLVLLGR